MKITNDISVSISEAKKNFSKVARLVDEKGSAIILDDNKPKYMIIRFENLYSLKYAQDEEVKEISRRLL